MPPQIVKLQKKREEYLKRMVNWEAEREIPDRTPPIPKYERQESGAWVEEGGLLVKFWRRVCM